MHDTFIFIHANGIAMDADDTRFTAMVVENGRISAVGSEDDVAPYIERGLPVIDLEGKTVLPGFIDTHQHLGITGQSLRGMDLRAATSLKAVLDAVTEAAETTEDGQWIFGFALNDPQLEEKRLPLKEELDAACAKNPVMLVQASWHLCALNTAALDILNLPPDLPGLDLGADDKPTGLVRDPGALTHVFPAISALTSPETKLAGFHAACEAALAQGITTLHCLEGGEYGPGDTRIVVEHQDSLPLHTVIWNQVMDIEETEALGLPRIGGCICADGAVDAYTAALFEPYTNQPGNCGTLNFTQQEMDDFIMQAHCKGLQIAIHCETDRSIEQVLSAMEKALAALPRKDHRHRIEHCEVPAPGQLKRMAEAGIIGSMQPAFLPFLVDMDDYEKFLGKERLRWLHPYRTMLDCGMTLCGGSDGPITPYTPLTGIQGAVTHPNEGERISPLEALRMFTIDAAFSAFEEKERGSIEPGKIADLVVLDADPTQVPAQTIASIKVVKTYVEGKPVDVPRDGPMS